MARGNIIVVGAGVIGLSTAIYLRDQGHDVRVLTDLAPTQTTSVVASAMCGPVINRGDDPSVAWEVETTAAMVDIAHTHPASGVHIERGLLVAPFPGQGPPVVETVLSGPIPVEPSKLPRGYQSGSMFEVPLVDMPLYMSYLEDRFISSGGTIDITHVEQLDDVVPEALCVVNCAGLRAGKLAADKDLRPSLGQHVVVTNPGIAGFFVEAPLGSEWTAFWAHQERVVLGSISRDAPEGEEPQTSDEVTTRILERALGVEPRLAEAQILGTEVGLRPNRHRVRLEADQHKGRGWVVHNYGHGGSGVSLSWGCAKRTAALVAEMVHA